MKNKHLNGEIQVYIEVERRCPWPESTHSAWDAQFPTKKAWLCVGRINGCQIRINIGLLYLWIFLVSKLRKSIYLKVTIGKSFSGLLLRKWLIEIAFLLDFLGSSILWVDTRFIYLIFNHLSGNLAIGWILASNFGDCVWILKLCSKFKNMNRFPGLENGFSDWIVWILNWSWNLKFGLGNWVLEVLN